MRITVVGLLLVFAVHLSWCHPRQSQDRGTESKAFWLKDGQEDLQRMLSQKINMNGAKNVIIFVGDGMGITTETAARIYKGQKAASKFGGEEADLVWQRWPFVGLSKTYNTDYQVSDSAGTATAIFTGVKTRLGMVGVDNSVDFDSCDPDRAEAGKLSSVLNTALELGKATGIVTNARITHATPAALYAHSQNRGWENDNKVPEKYRSQCIDIAHQMVFGDTASKVNVLFGGGLENFKLQADGGKRSDQDMVEAWKSRKIQANKTSFEVLFNKQDLDKWSQSEFVLGLFAKSHLPYITELEEHGAPSVSQMTRAALKRLTKSKEGFFLMVENGLIDNAHHATNAYRSLEETLEMDRAVQVALEMTNEEDTLIVVTADHSHTLTLMGYPKRGNPILGYVYDDKYNAILQPDGSKAAYPTLSYANGRGFEKHFTGDGRHPWVDVRDLDATNPIYLDKDFLQPTRFSSAEGDESHGGEDVGIYARGPMASLFTGVHEQNYIAHVVRYAMEKRVQKQPVKVVKNSAATSSPAGMIISIIAISIIILSQPASAIRS